MKDDLKDLKDCFTIHCLGSISDESYNFILKKIERLENMILPKPVIIDEDKVIKTVPKKIKDIWGRIF